MTSFCFCCPLVLLLLACTVALVTCRANYRDRIPNGHNVLHPCTDNVQWVGIGHISKGGGGDRNVFGMHFQEAGLRWTVELCEQDSDEDGRSNGEELGDPDCVWQEGQEPSTTQGITHPGVCDPVDSPACREHQHSITCDGDIEYECPEVAEPTTQQLDMRFPETNVPPVETTYYCKIFELPSDAEYHAIAFEPIVDNINVLHHMLLYGCDETIHQETDPEDCGMSDVACQHIIAIWTVGVDGYCLHPDVGMRFGSNSFKFFSIQTHWNNPELRSDYTDSSGLRMFYTSVLRPNLQGIADLGQIDIAIPPLSARYTVTGVCKSACTQGMPHPVNVTKAVIHMHYLGIGGKVELFRDGSLAYTILNEEVYNYESPVLHEFDPPLVVMAGDEIRTTCHFNTLDGSRRRENEVAYGEGTQDEMCFAFLFYYPALGDFTCTQFGAYDLCPGEECDYDAVGEQFGEIFAYIGRAGLCDWVALTSGTCNDACYSALYVLLQDRCVEDIVIWLKSLPPEHQFEGMDYVLMVYHTCNSRRLEELEAAEDATTQPLPEVTEGSTGGANGLVYQLSCVLCVLVHVSGWCTMVG